MSLDPNKTYLVWNGTEFPNSTNAQFKAPAGSTIDWGDGTVETFDTASTAVNTHTYTDGKTEHTIAISGPTSIGNSAFSSCSSLTSITIGNSVTSIGSSAFSGCNSLTSVTIPNSVTSIGNSAFNGCSSLTSITIGNSVTSIGSSVFYGCGSLTSVTIPNSVTSIGNSVFSSCSSLTSITIPNSVTSIGDGAFYGCSSLASVTIGNGVTSIGNSAFSSCSSLTQLILFPSTPPTLASGAIPANVQSIYVQQSSKANYQAATNWTTFASKIVSDNIYLSFVRFNQKNKEYIDKKLTAPTTPTADSVVTMAANGTTGTKALSEFGGKLYRHKIIVSFTGGDGTTSAYLYIYSSKSTAYEKNNYSEIKGFYTAACDSSSNGGAVSIYFNTSSGLVSGVVYGMLMGEITYLNNVGIEDFSDIVTEL